MKNFMKTSAFGMLLLVFLSLIKSEAPTLRHLQPMLHHTLRGDVGHIDWRVSIGSIPCIGN